MEKATGAGCRPWSVRSFGKGRALERMVSDARSCEQGARSERRDSAALSVMGFQLLRGAGDMPASTDFKSNLELRRLAQAPLQTYSNCPEVGGPGFVAAAIYGATRRIILLLEWSKNLPIDQRRSVRQWNGEVAAHAPACSPTIPANEPAAFDIVADGADGVTTEDVLV